MTAETATYSLLSNAAGVTALAGDRIYPDVLPEGGSYPAIAFARSGSDPLVGISGQVFGTDVTLSINCWAETRSDADAVATAIEAVLPSGGFTRAGRDSAYDPETGLFGSIVTATYFET